MQLPKNTRSTERNEAPDPVEEFYQVYVETAQPGSRKLETDVTLTRTFKKHKEAAEYADRNTILIQTPQGPQYKSVAWIHVWNPVESEDEVAA